MRGQVLKRERAGEPGLILGDDGRRYLYSQAQVRADATLVEGAQVDFIDLGDEARDIYLMPAVPVAAPIAEPGRASGAVPVPAMPASAAKAARADSLWAYFLRALSRNYLQFNGRARRAEYWGFTLFLFLVVIVLLIIDGVISFTFFGTDEYGDPVYLPILTILFYIYCIIPGIAITVRRLHDLDMSGWMYLLSLIPYVGGLIVFVFMLLDSKPATNKHGASPKYAGLRMADTFA